MSSEEQLDKNQLNLWKQLNRLYGKSAPQSENRPGLDAGDSGVQARELFEDDETGHGFSAEGSGPGSLKKEQEQLKQDDAVNELCVSCERSCKQSGPKFLLYLCPKTHIQRPLQHESRLDGFRQAIRGAGQLNELCRKCKHTCKQNTEKINQMLCLGYAPLAPDNGSE